MRVTTPNAFVNKIRLSITIGTYLIYVRFESYKLAHNTWLHDMRIVFKISV